MYLRHTIREKHGKLCFRAKRLIYAPEQKRSADFPTFRLSGWSSRCHERYRHSLLREGLSRVRAGGVRGSACSGKQGQ
jgi:hypothetical protein